jgi:tetratricopeptide (TPR) repeat protein
LTDTELASAGQLLLTNGAYREAKGELAQSVKLRPDDPGTWAQLAYAQFKIGEPKAALVSALRAKSIRDTADVESLLGDIYEASDDSVASAQCYQTAIAMAPQQESFRLALAVELMQHQTFAPAIDLLKIAALEFPNSSRVQTALGLAYYLADDDHLAVEALLNAIRLDPAPDIPRRYLGEIALQQSADPEVTVVQELCGYADAHPTDPRANAVCGGLQSRGSAAPEWPAILKRLKASALAAPHSAFEQCTLAKALDEAREEQGTRQALETCARLDPDSVEAHFRLARLYRRLGLMQLSRRQVELRAFAEQRQTQANSERYQRVTKFLYTLRPPAEP